MKPETPYFGWCPICKQGWACLWVNESEMRMIAVCTECETTWRDINAFLNSPSNVDSFLQVDWDQPQTAWREGRRSDVEGTPLMALVKGYWN